MGAGASSALGPPRPGDGASSAWALGPPLLWDHQGPRRMGEGASSVLGPPRRPMHGHEGLFRFGTTNAPAAWVWGPL